MIKKKTNTSKKQTVSKKKTISAKKKPVSAKSKPLSAKKKPAAIRNASTPAPANERNTGTHEQNIPLLPVNTMEDITEGTRSEMKDFEDITRNNLTALQRKRKIGAGTRNYGFIDKVSDIAAANSDYAHFFNLNDLKNCIRNIEMCRDLYLLLLQFARAASNTMMIYSDDAYSMALNYYNTVKEQAKQGDNEAVELYDELKKSFKRKKRISETPTGKEIIKDVKALERGTKDGKIVIENIKPKLTGGVRKVIDDVHKGKAEFKESEDGEIIE
jgi:hypothetical protein